VDKHVDIYKYWHKDDEKMRCIQKEFIGSADKFLDESHTSLTMVFMTFVQKLICQPNIMRKALESDGNNTDNYPQLRSSLDTQNNK